MAVSSVSFAYVAKYELIDVDFCIPYISRAQAAIE